MFGPRLPRHFSLERQISKPHHFDRWKSSRSEISFSSLHQARTYKGPYTLKAPIHSSTSSGSCIRSTGRSWTPDWCPSSFGLLVFNLFGQWCISVLNCCFAQTYYLRHSVQFQKELKRIAVTMPRQLQLLRQKMHSIRFMQQLIVWRDCQPITTEDLYNTDTYSYKQRLVILTDWHARKHKVATSNINAGTSDIRSQEPQILCLNRLLYFIKVGTNSNKNDYNEAQRKMTETDSILALL